MTISLRAATVADATNAAPLIYSSGPIAFDYIFGRPRSVNALPFLTAAFRDGRGMFGHRNHWIAEKDGEVVGTMMCCSAKEHQSLNVGSLATMIKHFGLLTALGVARRGLRVEKMIKAPKKHCLYIGHLGVAANAQGQGIGRQLIEHALNLPAYQHLDTAALDVALTNPNAQRLYERLGFAVQEFRALKDSQLEGFAIPNHHYMEYPFRAVT